MPHYSQCRLARTAVLEGDFQAWLQQLIEVWNDIIEHNHATDFHLVVPTPAAAPFQPRDEPHLLIVQRAPDEGRAALITAVKPSHTGRPVDHMATFMPHIANKQDILTIAQLEMHCYPQLFELQCMIWHGDRQLRDQQQWQLFNGISIEVIINPPPEPALADPWEDDPDELNLLQGHARVQLSLETLLPATDAVKLISVHEGLELPQYIEIPKDTTETGVMTELQSWGIRGRALRFGQRDEYLVLPQDHVVPPELHHYMLCNDDTHDTEGSIVHTHDKQMGLSELMLMLCQLGYDRAVIIEQEDLDIGFHRVRFRQCQPQVAERERKSKTRSDWPSRTLPMISRQPMFNLEHVEQASGQCQVRTPFDQRDLRELVQAGDGVLCTDFAHIELPDFVREALQPSNDPFSHDRWLIYTDGSSQTKYRHQAPEYADACGAPDAWAMLVLGETFHDDGSSTVQTIGWTAQPVRTDAGGQSFAGASRIGAEVAEREGLLAAGIWRLTQNTNIPTVFCVDSRVTGGQAVGEIGTQAPDLSYRLLRGVFQCLQRGLPAEHVQVHHTNAHAGDPFNEFVDIVAKNEAKASFNLPRVRLDMQHWIPIIPHLWLCFGHSHGLPSWHDTLRAEPPELPKLDSNECNLKRPQDHRNVHCHISLASLNVQSLSRRPEGHAGKLHFLYEQVKTFKLNLIGIQEGRNEEGMSKSHDILRICAGHHKHQFGVELWVNLLQPIGHDEEGQPSYFEAHQFQVAYRDPWRLIVRCDNSIFSAWLIVAHGPHSGRAREEREQWWQRTEELIFHHSDGDPWFWLIDANASPGNEDDTTVLTADLPTSANTAFFRSCLASNAMCLPSTTSCHQGPRGTWKSIAQDDYHCIDYVAIPRVWLPACTFSSVLEDLDVGNAHEDHRAVAVQLQWNSLHPVVEDSVALRPPKLDWLDPEVQAVLKRELCQAQALPWKTDVETQASQLSQCLHQAMKKCKRPKNKPKKTYITEQIWRIRGEKLCVRKKLRQIRHHCDTHVLHATFGAWKKRHTEQERAEHRNYQTTMICVKLRYHILHYQLTGRLRQQLQQAKHAALRNRLQQFHETTPASMILKGLKDFMGPTNLKLCKKQTIPHVRNEQGDYCQLPSEALAVWIDFFRNMEGGKRQSWSELRHDWIAALQAGQERQFEVSSADMPTLTDLELALRRTACGKASGADAIPGELLHLFPTEIAALVYPSIWKLMLHGGEDLSYKGGLLVQAYKGRGPADLPSSHRSLLISSQIGKAIHRSVRSFQATIFEKFLQAQQVGGKRHMPVCFGLHLVRAHLRSAKQAGESAAVVFIDLKEAFYRIFRPLCMQHVVTDEALACFLHKLNLPSSALHELHTLLEGPTALEQANMPPLMRKGIAAIHCNTHFWMRQQRDVVQTAFGSRPGDPFADVVFSFVWSLVLRRLQSQMIENGLIVQHPALDALPLFEARNQPHEWADLHEYLGPTWMDDTAICLKHDGVQGLIDKATHTAALLLDLCLEHGLTPNLSRGKTELLLSLRGAQSRQAKRDLFGPHATGTLLVISEHATHHVPVTNRYLHLGGTVHHGSDQRCEI